MPDHNHEKNRKAWNEMVRVHYDHPDYRLDEFLNGWSSLKPIELDALGDVNNRSLLHLMCQFGMDSLCWARRGAKVTGVDISDDSIELARELAAKIHLKAEFVRSDVLDLVGRIDSQFDIVFMSHGTLCWLSDMNRLARVVAHYLKPGGTFFVVDDHPVHVLYETENVGYLDKNPTTYSGETDYCDRSYVIQSELVEFQHPLGEIVNSFIGAGLRIVELNEYNKGFWAVHEDWVQRDSYWYPPDGPPRYPLMFSLKAVKP